MSIATAVPEHRITQDDAADFSRQIFAGRGADFERLQPVYANAGIETRYSSMPMEWLGRDRSWPENSQAYRTGAVDLLERAAWESCERAGLHPRDIDGLVVASTTGIATPSLDALLMERLPFRRDIARLPIFGLGCAGGVLGLARTAALSRAQPEGNWLFLVVELCCLTFRPRDLSKSNIIASALFGDGAAGAVVSCAGDGPALCRWGEYTWPDSLDVMGWHIEEDGLGVLFSRDIPTLVRNDLCPRVDAFLSPDGITVRDVDEWLFHPGGMKVLDALEDGLSLGRDALVHSRNVLRDFGNMSATTVMFVLKAALEAGASGRLLAGALGPGFTAGFLVLEHQP
ncbi:MAG: type III polyketide synthase [Pseudomonadota bacterium]